MDANFKNALKRDELITLAIYFNIGMVNVENFYNRISGVKNELSKIIDDRNNNYDIELANFIWKENQYHIFQNIPEETLHNKINVILEHLNNLRNYFSHYYHSESILIFGNDDRDLFQKLYNTAEANIKSDFGNVELFNEDKITKDGIVWFLSMFLYNYEAQRCFYFVSGLKRNEDLYKPKRKLFSFFSTDYNSNENLITDFNFLHFHKIIQYLNRNPNTSEDSDYLRKTNKFIHFAVKFLEDFNLLPGIRFLKKKNFQLDNEYKYFINRNNIFFEWDNEFNFTHYDDKGSTVSKKLKGSISYQTLVYLIYAALLKPENVIIERIRKFYNEYLSILEDVKNNNNPKLELVEIKNLPVIVQNIIKETNFTESELKEKISNRIKFILTEISNNENGLAGNGKVLRAFDKMQIVMKFLNDTLTDTQRDEKTQKSKAKLNVGKYKELMNYVRFYDKEKQKVIDTFFSGRWKFKNETEVFSLLKESKNLEELFIKVVKKNKIHFENLLVEIETADSKQLNEIANSISVKNDLTRNIDEIYISGLKSNGIALPRNFIKEFLRIDKSVFNTILEKEKLKDTIDLIDNYYSLSEEQIKNKSDKEIGILNRKNNEFKVEDILLSCIAKKYLIQSERFEKIKNEMKFDVKDITQKKYVSNIEIKGKKVGIGFSDKSVHLFDRLNYNKILLGLLNCFKDGEIISISALNDLEDKYQKDRKEFIDKILTFEEKVVNQNLEKIRNENLSYVGSNKIIEFAQSGNLTFYEKEFKAKRRSAFHNEIDRFSSDYIRKEWDLIKENREKKKKVRERNIFFYDKNLWKLF